MENFKGIDIFCAFEEDVESPEKYVRWYESPPGTTLFHITKFPISGKYFEARIEEEIEHRWGRTPELNRIRDTHKLIAVKIDKDMGGLKNTIPRLVQLDLGYYQVSQREKTFSAR